MDRFKIGSTLVTGRKLVNDKLVVSFLNLPAYIPDEEILERMGSGNSDQNKKKNVAGNEHCGRDKVCKGEIHRCCAVSPILHKVQHS